MKRPKAPGNAFDARDGTVVIGHGMNRLARNVDLHSLNESLTVKSIGTEFRKEGLIFSSN